MWKLRGKKEMEREINPESRPGRQLSIRAGQGSRERRVCFLVRELRG